MTTGNAVTDRHRTVAQLIWDDHQTPSRSDANRAGSCCMLPTPPENLDPKGDFPFFH